MDSSLRLGRVVIELTLVDDDVLVAIESDDSLSVLQKVGMLEMAKDAVLHPTSDDDDSGAA